MAHQHSPPANESNSGAGAQNLSLILGPVTRGLRVKRLIANGGFGEVYEIEYTQTRDICQKIDATFWSVHRA